MKIKKPFGMAIRITKNNRKALALTNAGLAPSKKAVGDILVFPYSYDKHVDILNRKDFNEKFTWENNETPKYFVEVSKK